MLDWAALIYVLWKEKYVAIRKDGREDAERPQEYLSRTWDAQAINLEVRKVRHLIVFTDKYTDGHSKIANHKPLRAEEKQWYYIRRIYFHL